MSERHFDLELRTRKDGEAVEGDFRLDLKEVLRQEGGEQEGEWFVQIHYFSGQSLSVVPGNVITVRCSALPNVHLATFDQSTFTQGAKESTSGGSIVFPGANDPTRGRVFSLGRRLLEADEKGRIGRGGGGGGGGEIVFWLEPKNKVGFRKSLGVRLGVALYRVEQQQRQQEDEFRTPTSKVIRQLQQTMIPRVSSSPGGGPQQQVDHSNSHEMRYKGARGGGR